MEGFENFAAFVEYERNRLNGEREALTVQRGDIDAKINGLDLELAAINAYEATKEGRLVGVTSNGSGTRRGRRSGGGGTQQVGRRGSKREGLLKVINEGDGLTRGQILEKMGLKGDKAGEMSVSNALTALLKKKQIRRDGKKYLRAA